MIEHKDHMNLLLDYYGVLLTEKQQEILRCYFADDLSLAEIAENLSISRSAVHDVIKRSEQILENYEAKLTLIATKKKQDEIIRKYQKSKIDEVKQLLDELENIE